MFTGVWWLKRLSRGGLGLAPLVVVCLCDFALGASSPLRWRWSNPRPHGNNIIDLAFSPQLNLAVQVSEKGQIHTSSDLTLWTPRESGSSLYLRSVAFLGAANPRIVITGENGTVLFADSVDHFQPGTLLDGPTSDWLEAVATSPSLAVAVGDSGAIYTSVNGISWKRQTPVPSITAWLRGVAFGGGAFVAAGDDGFVARSGNGTNWVKITSGTSQHLNGVHHSDGRFTIVGANGTSLYSTNGGLAWFPDSSGAAFQLLDAASGNGSRLLVGEDEMRLDESGVWTDLLTISNAPPAWSYYTAMGRPNYLLAAGRTGLIAEGIQPPGGDWSWRQADNTLRHWLFDLFYASNLFVAVGDRATVLTSGDGIDWSLELTPAPLSEAIFLGVGGTTNLLVAAGSGGSLMISPNQQTNITTIITNSSGTVITNFILNTLGIFWYPIDSETTNDLQGVTYGQGLYVVTGDNGFVMTSPNGTNWTSRTTPSSELLSSATAWPGGMVATGDDGTVLASPDGTTWSVVDAGTTNWLYKVRYLNGTLLAVGQNGTIRTSSDALKWSNPNSGTSAWLTDATYVGDTYFVVGTQGTVLTSSNAMTWSSQGSITLKSFYAAASDGAYLLAAGIEGIVLRSPIVPDLTPISILSFARIASTNAPFNIQNLYLLGGKPDQQFTLDRRGDLQTNMWATGPFLEFFDSSGTLFYLETFPPQGAPAQEYYRATLTLEP